MKVLGPTTDFPSWGSGKGTEYPKRTWLWRSAGFDYRTSIGLWKQRLRGHKQNLVFTRTQEKGAMTSQETEPDLPGCAWESLAEAWLDSDLPGGRALSATVLGGPTCWHKSFWMRLLLLSLPLPWGQTTGREHSPTHQQKIKGLLSMALPTRARPSFPHSQCFPSGSLHKPLIFIHQRADRMKTTVTEN